MSTKRILSWWSCSYCGAVNEKKNQAFKNPTVDFCIGCYKDWIKSNHIKTEKDFDKALRHFQVISEDFYNLCVEYLKEEKK